MPTQREMRTTPDGVQEWRLISTQKWLNGKLHNEDGPALIRADGHQEWRRYGQLHRIGGPAIIRANGKQEWWVHGKRIRAPKA